MTYKSPAPMTSDSTTSQVPITPNPSDIQQPKSPVGIACTTAKGCMSITADAAEAAETAVIKCGLWCVFSAQHPYIIPVNGVMKEDSETKVAGE